MAQPWTPADAAYARDFGARLQWARRAKRLTQDALAIMLEQRDQQSISLYERGEQMPRLPVVVALASALSVTLDWLLTPMSPPSPQPDRLEESEAAPADGPSRRQWADLYDELDERAREEVWAVGRDRLANRSPPPA